LAKGTGDAGEEDKATSGASASGGPSDRVPAGGAVSSAGKYVPPSKRDGAKTGDAMPDRRRSKYICNNCKIVKMAKFVPFKWYYIIDVSEKESKISFKFNHNYSKLEFC
jgi:hypothetical protein